MREIETTDFTATLWARKWLILAVALIAGLATYVVYDRKPRVYQSSARLLLEARAVEATVNGGAAVTGTDRNNQNQALLIRSPAVAEEAAKRLPGFRGDPSELLGRINAQSLVGSDFLTVSATTGDPESAARIANAFAEGYIASRSIAFRRELEQSIESNTLELHRLRAEDAPRSARRQLQDRVRRLQILASTARPNVEVTEEAQPNPTPIAPKPERNALFGFVLGLLGAGAVTTLLSGVSRRVSGVLDLERIYDAPVLTSLPRMRKPAATESGRPVAAQAAREPLRRLLADFRMRSAVDDEDRRTILITSAQSAEGKSTVARNFALVAAESGARVALVEGDLRKPVHHRLLGVARDAPGLSDVLAGRVALAEALQPVRVGVGVEAAVVGDASQVTVTAGELVSLPSGTPTNDPPTLLTSPVLAATLEELRASFDYVLVDSPPLLPVSDALPLLALVDGVLLVARPRRTSIAAAERLQSVLGRVPHSRVIGVVANDVPADDIEGLGYGGY